MCKTVKVLLFELHLVLQAYAKYLYVLFFLQSSLDENHFTYLRVRGVYLFTA